MKSVLFWTSLCLISSSILVKVVTSQASDGRLCGDDLKKALHFVCGGVYFSGKRSLSDIPTVPQNKLFNWLNKSK